MRIAVLGVGRWGSNIVRDLVELGITVVAVDPDADARRRALSLGADEVREDIDLGSVDGIVVATPASTHTDLLVGLARFAGPIACEKPLTVSVDQLSQALAAVGDRLTVLHVWRYHPGIELLGEMGRTGAIGRPTMLRTVRSNWTSPRSDVDPVWTLLPHDLSIAVEVFGSVPPLQWATTEVLDGRVVGAVACFGSEAGPTLLAEVSTRSPGKVRTVRLHGERGVATFDALDPAAVTVASGRGATPEISRVAVSTESALKRELRAFVRHVGGGAPPKTDAAEGAAVVAGVAAVLESAG